jgi:hypothetical protein
MGWWSRVWRRETVSAFEPEVPYVRVTLPGWSEDAPNKDPRTWHDSEGDVLSIQYPAEGFSVLLDPGEAALRTWCRELAEGQGGGLVEARTIAGALGPSFRLIYKRLNFPAYVYTGMLLTSIEEISLLCTVVASERGATGLREAVVTSKLMSAGKLDLDGYKRRWAQDPYDPEYYGVDRRVLRFLSDDESYDDQFPQHPLSKVRRVLGALPHNLHFDQAGSM